MKTKPKKVAKTLSETITRKVLLGKLDRRKVLILGDIILLFGAIWHLFCQFPFGSVGGCPK